MSKTKQKLLPEKIEEDKHLDDAYYYDKYNVNRERVCHTATSSIIYDIFQDIADINCGKRKFTTDES